MTAIGDSPLCSADVPRPPFSRNSRGFVPNARRRNDFWQVIDLAHVDLAA